MLALSEMPASDPAGKALYALSSDSVVLNDRWLPDALTIAGARHGSAFLRAALADAKSPFSSPPRDLIPNPGFENSDNSAWKARTFQGKADFAIDAAVSHSGKASLRISSSEGADASWQARIAVEPQTEYRLTAWLRCQDLARPGKGGRGALVNIQDLPVQTDFLIGTADWKKVTTSFKTGDIQELSLNLLFGGWGQCAGTAWWDDVSLTKIDQTARLSGILRGVATAFAARSKPEDLHALHALLASKTPVAELIAGGLFPPTEKPHGPTLEQLAATHQILKLSTAPNLQFAPQQLSAKAGQPIAIAFENPDLMQHNLVIGQPGTLQVIGNAANALITQPDAIAKSYVPSIPQVLASTPLLNPNDTAIVTLPALAPGNYPFLCTFPGHWVLMQGTLQVK